MTSCPDFVLNYAMTQWLTVARNRRQALALHASTALLTFQGPCFVMDVPPGVVDSLTDMSQLVDFTRQLPAAQELEAAFKLHCQELADNLGATAHCFCLEICTDTWSDSGTLRLHGHLFMKSADKKLRAESSRLMMFRDSEPHLATQLWGKQCSRANWAGAYYCVAPKLGAVCQGGTARPFKDFPVSPDWVFHLVESSKITYLDAREQLILCAKGVHRRLLDLDTWHKQRQQLELAKKVAQSSHASRACLTAFPNWPVVMTWLIQNCAPNMCRKQFLVLDGPSKLGKTQYAKCLFPFDTVLELNCANLTHVCLPGFQPLKHQCVLWDECTPKLVAQNRKVFQHPPCFVDLGHSPTAQHLYNVYLNDSVSIVASNSWIEQAALLCSSDREWLAENSLVLRVTEPLWQSPPRRVVSEAESSW